MNTIKQLSKLTLFFLLVCWISTVQAAKVDVSVTRNPVNLNESFQIIFTANDAPDDKPDFSALERDFTILNQSHRSHASWVNGQASQTIQWVLNVMPKKAGNVTIPAIAFGSDLTDPLTIEVNQTDTAVQSDTDLFLEVEASPSEPYLQSQVIYTLRLFRRVDIAQAQLSEPELNDAVVTKLDDDHEFITKVKGIDYSVTERKFAIFPQKSGKVTIKPLILTAEVLSHAGRGFNDFFSTTQTRRILSKEITLNVKPAPVTFTAPHWLAAEELTIEQQWSSDFEQIKVGEPITRTLTLQAKGATVGSLPELNQINLDALKTYADQPVLKEQKATDGLLALREEKIAIIASKAGSYTLPAISIPWFNTKTNKMEIANIPATTITVQAAAVETLVNKAPINKSQVTNAPVVESVTETRELSNWFWVSVVLFLLWLMSLVYIFTRLPKTQTTPVISDFSDDSSLKTSIEQLRRACAENNAHAAKNALLAWGKIKYNALGLAKIADCCDARLRDEILLLNQVLYGKSALDWQGKKLFQAFAENKARAKMPALKQQGLEPLFRL